MRYGLAILACAGIFFAYGMIGAALGWQRGGGLIPMLILLAVLGATWRGITKSGKVSENDTTTDEQK